MSTAMRHPMTGEAFLNWEAGHSRVQRNLIAELVFRLKGTPREGVI